MDPGCQLSCANALCCLLLGAEMDATALLEVGMIFSPCYKTLPRRFRNPERGISAEAAQERRNAPSKRGAWLGFTGQAYPGTQEEGVEIGWG